MRDALRGDAFFRRLVGCSAHVGGTRMARALARCRLAKRGAPGGNRGSGARRLAPCHGAQHIRETGQRHACDLPDVMTREAHRQGLPLEPLAVTLRAVAPHHEARGAVLHQCAVSGREGVQHIFACAHERTLVARLHLAAHRGARLGRRETRVHRHGGLLFGKEDPVARLLRQIAPGLVDVDAHGHENVAQVLPVPGRRPGGNRAFADAEGVVGHHRLLGDFEDPAQSVAGRACALRRVGRKILRVQHRLPRGIVSCPRIEHAQQARQRRDAAHRRARARRAALLLQGHRRRQAVDGVDRRHADLIDQPARIRRDRFEVAPLRFGIQGAEGERGLARARDAAENNQCVTGNVDIDVAQIVFTRTTYAHETIAAIVGILHEAPSWIVRAASRNVSSLRPRSSSGTR